MKTEEAEERSFADQTVRARAAAPLDRGTIALGALGILLAVAGLFVRSARVLGGALGILGTLACLAAGARISRVVEEQRVAMVRQENVLSCRMRLESTRTRLQQGRLARCVHDLSEADEDIMGWSVAELEKHVIPFFQLARAE